MATPPQEPTPRLREVDKLFSGRMRAEDRIIAGIIKKMLSSSSDLSQRAQRRILRLDIDSRGNVKQTNKNLAELERINLLLDQGANSIINRALRDFKSNTSNLNKFYGKELFLQEN